VVRKVIRTGATEFRYQREMQPMPKIGSWRNRLDEMLRANEDKLAPLSRVRPIVDPPLSRQLIFINLRGQSLSLVAARLVPLFYTAQN
jgi:hypothetical protein